MGEGEYLGKLLCNNIILLCNLLMCVRMYIRTSLAKCQTNCFSICSYIRTCAYLLAYVHTYVCMYVYSASRSTLQWGHLSDACQRIRTLPCYCYCAIAVMWKGRGWLARLGLPVALYVRTCMQHLPHKYVTCMLLTSAMNNE